MKMMMRPGGHGLALRTQAAILATSTYGPLGAPTSGGVPMLNLTRIAIPPSLGERCFLLRSQLNIQEIAVRIDDMQYYTLPSIAKLQFPAGTVLKGSWESVYHSLQPFRDDIINDGHRIRSISELAASPLPEGEPGRRTNDVLDRIAQLFRSSPRDLPPQLSEQLGLLESCWLYVRRTRIECLQIDSRSKHSSSNKFAALFHFDSRRTMLANLSAHAVRSFHWAHNTDVPAVIDILKNEEMIRPSKWCDAPRPDADCANWSSVRLPPTGFYCRGSFDSSIHATQSAARHGGITYSRPWCIGGTSMIRQHIWVSRGGVLADIAAAHFHDFVHSRAGRWKLRSTLAVPAYVAIFW